MIPLFSLSLPHLSHILLFLFYFSPNLDSYSHDYIGPTLFFSSYSPCIPTLLQPFLSLLTLLVPLLSLSSFIKLCTFKCQTHLLLQTRKWRVIITQRLLLLLVQLPSKATILMFISPLIPLLLQFTNVRNFQRGCVSVTKFILVSLIFPPWFQVPIQGIKYMVQ